MSTPPPEHSGPPKPPDSGQPPAPPSYSPPPAYPPPPGYPPPGYAPPPGYPPQGHPAQGHPPQGYPPAGYPPPGYAPYGPPDPYAKSRVVAGILGILLGGFGVHRFYLGDTRTGVIQIIVTLVTCGFGALWGFVEGILYLVGSEGYRTDATGRPLRD